MDSATVFPPFAEAPATEWTEALVAVVRDLARRRGLTAGELGECVAEQATARLARDVRYGAAAFLARLFADEPDDAVHVEGPEDLRLAPEELALIGVVAREAVTNARRHACPPGREVRIWVRLARDGARVRLVIRDNGIGMPDLAPDPMRGRGLMAAAADRLGGFVRLASAPFGGALVALDFTPA